MSDIRFIIMGIGLIFAGFILIGVLGAELNNASIQEEEFGDCYQYFEDKPPIPIDCEVMNQDKTIVSGLSIGLIGAGILALVKGVRGNWDAKVNPQDIAGPGGEKTDKPDSEEPKGD